MKSADNRTGAGRAETPRPGAAVRAEGFGVKGPRGWAFQGVDVTAGPGSLVALAGPSGSGRTCLLLALTGRMKARAGHAEVGGVRLPRKMAAVRRFSALAHVPGVSDLDPAFTVAEHLREAALLRRRFAGSPLALLRSRATRTAENRRRVDAALEAAGLDPLTLPKGERTAVRDLERLEALRLTVAMALLGEPRLLAVDDTDLKLGDAEAAAAWSMLRSVADGGVTVLAVCNEVPAEADVVVRTGEAPGAGTAAEAPGVTGARRAGRSGEPDRGGGADRPGGAADADGTAPTGDGAGAGAAGQARNGGNGGNGEGAGRQAGSAGDAGNGRSAAGAGSAGDDRRDVNHEDDEEGAADAFAETGRA
ncbi:ATP-binding cassette domain-containing protein [Streptomyces fradiae]|uniref:ATP-binding cassette domain-containing protein n=1 Tax=Streptomyces fradiae TaxID=1906 RepID=UPI0039881D72